MNLKEKILLISAGTKEECELNLLTIKKKIIENNYLIDFEKEVSELTGDDYYHLGRALNLSDFSYPYFPTALADETKIRIEEIGQVIGLIYGVPALDKIEYFNIFDLADEHYEFQSDIDVNTNNREVLQRCLQAFYINTNLKKSLKIKPNPQDFDLLKFRSTENLLVLYTQKNSDNKVFYCLTNPNTDTYKFLKALSN